MYLLTKHKNKIATPVNLKPRRASCHFTTCVRRRGKEGVFSGFQDSRPSVQESSHYYIRLTHVLLNGPKRRKTYYALHSGIQLHVLVNICSPRFDGIHLLPMIV
ncbi:hypothetical protein YC2023_048330 [Brassica napus]